MVNEKVIFVTNITYKDSGSTTPTTSASSSSSSTTTTTTSTVDVA